MRVDWTNKNLIFGRLSYSDDGHYRARDLATNIKATARNKKEKPIGRKLHAVLRDDTPAKEVVAIRLYDTDIITFTNTDVTINYGEFKTRLTLEMINEFINRYKISVHRASRGPYKGEWFIHYFKSRRYRTGEDGILVLPGGTRVGYTGIDLDGVGPNWSADTIFQEYKARAGRAITLQNEIVSLGFYSIFNMEGYKLPKDRSAEHMTRLSRIAHQFGYRTVAEAWLDGGIMINDLISDQDIEMLLSGGAKLLHSLKEDQHASNRY